MIHSQQAIESSSDCNSGGEALFVCECFLNDTAASSFCRADLNRIRRGGEREKEPMATALAGVLFVFLQSKNQPNLPALRASLEAFFYGLI
jgi:hypothetical protein